MKRYETLEDVTLEIKGRKKEYKKGEIVLENTYTKTFKDAFTMVGDEIGYGKIGSKPKTIDKPKKTKNDSSTRRVIRKTQPKVVDKIGDLENKESK